MVSVQFTPLQKWSLPPRKNQIDRTASREEQALARDGFRNHRVARLPIDCPPWVMGQELGWVVPSPVTIAMEPIRDIEFDVPAGEDPSTVARRLGVSEAWHRDNAWIGCRNATWMRQFDFRGDHGWEGMFLPNGAGTVEWRLGWAAQIPEDYFLLLADAGVNGVSVPWGIVTARTVASMVERGGFSLPLEVTSPVTIRRGDPVARLILLHRDSLQARAHWPDAESGDEEGDSDKYD